MVEGMSPSPEQDKEPREDFLARTKMEALKLVEDGKYKSAVQQFLVDMLQYETNQPLALLGMIFLQKEDLNREDAESFINGQH